MDIFASCYFCIMTIKYTIHVYFYNRINKLQIITKHKSMYLNNKKINK